MTDQTLDNLLDSADLLINGTTAENASRFLATFNNGAEAIFIFANWSLAEDTIPRLCQCENVLSVEHYPYD